MIFQYPHICCGTFEIPDDWLAQSGAAMISSQQEAYITSSEKEFLLIPIAEIEPPKRNPSVIGLHEDRTVNVLKALASNDPLPPVEVTLADGKSNFKYKMHHGYHRFHAALALGFTKLPSIIVEPLW